MTLARRHWPLLAAVLLGPVGEAFAGDEDATEYVLPDPAYIERECDKVDTTLQWALADVHRTEKIDAVRARKLAAVADEVCAQRRRGAMSADVWQARFDAAYTAFAGTVFPCASGEHCLQQSITSRQPFPANLASYSVFLFTDTTWLKKTKAAEIEAIHDAFKRMGDSLGQTKGTIWLAKTSGSLQPDVDRGKAMADVFQLDYNDGPYVVTSSVRPDLADASSSVIVIRLKDIAPERIVNVLNVLEQDLRRGSEVRYKAILVQEVWQRFRSLTRKGGGMSLDDVKMDFTAGKK